MKSPEGAPVSPTAELACRCGNVRGTLREASPETVTRAICYCDDCQAFAHRLGRADLLDAYGGSDILQVAPAALEFREGLEHIVGLRLSPKGLYRFHTSCCNTPVGNTFSPRVPFIGIVTQVFASGGNDPDTLFGKPLGSIYGNYAINPTPAASKKWDLPLTVRAMSKMLGWKLRGKGSPHPFFERETQASRYPITTLTLEEREALRPLCGPQPKATATSIGA
jgi:hypothetical protein